MFHGFAGAGKAALSRGAKSKGLAKSVSSVESGLGAVEAAAPAVLGLIGLSLVAGAVRSAKDATLG